MAHSGRNGRKRRGLWRTNPRCHWCGIVTILALPTKKMDPEIRNRLATIDHLRPRWHPKRTEPNLTGERRIVLACWKCNHDRDCSAYNRLPKEELWKRSGSYPQQYRTD